MSENIKEQERYLDIQRIYIKDVSLETPVSPEIFRQEWQPEVAIDLGVENKLIEKEVYEVVLTVTVTAKLDKKVAFLVEVHQAAIFRIVGFDEQGLRLNTQLDMDGQQIISYSQLSSMNDGYSFENSQSHYFARGITRVR